MNAQIFLGSLIHPVKKYCLPSWVDTLKDIRGIRDIVLINTSPDEQFMTYAEGIPYDVHSAPGNNVFHSISAGRKELLRKFLDTDATHFFSLECDVFVEPSVAQDLAAFQQPIVNVPYILGYIYEPERKLKDDFLISITDERRVHYTMREFLEHADGNPLVAVNEAGLGCSMIERHVIEAYYPQLIVSDERLDDQAFYRFCRENGIPRVASVSLISQVRHYPHFHMEYGTYDQYLRRKEKKP
jgi:hypothetical protein